MTSAQGFLFARPLPEEDVESLLQEADDERHLSLNGG